MNSPISRIGSTTRLNQMSPTSRSPNQQNAQSPLTGTPYMINTVNTTTGTTPAILTQNQQQIQQQGYNAYSTDLKIFKEIERLEALISGVSKSIGIYKSPELDKVKELVSTVDSIDSIIGQIKDSTQLQREHSLKANQSNIELNQLFKEILLEMKSYRKTLSELPTATDTKIKHENNEVTTETLLEYALKLSKFSKIPRMIDANITASNFVWPGEDSLRRGVLAMVSNDPSKFMDFDVSTTESREETAAQEDPDKMEVDNESDEAELRDFEDVGDLKKKEHTDAVEGLDLFDSDDDDD